MQAKNNMFTEYKNDNNSNNNQKVETITKNALNLKQNERPPFVINWYKTKMKQLYLLRELKMQGLISTP